jgi:hypothetical protein
MLLEGCRKAGLRVPRNRGSYPLSVPSPAVAAATGRKLRGAGGTGIIKKA